MQFCRNSHVNTSSQHHHAISNIQQMEKMNNNTAALEKIQPLTVNCTQTQTSVDGNVQICCQWLCHTANAECNLMANGNMVWIKGDSISPLLNMSILYLFCYTTIWNITFNNKWLFINKVNIMLIYIAPIQETSLRQALRYNMHCQGITQFTCSAHPVFHLQAE